jgi:hypothetical protein
MERTLKTDALSIVGVISATAVIFFFLCFHTTTRKSLSDYTAQRAGDTISQAVLPDLENLPSHSKIEYRYRHKRMVIFSADTMLLAVTYDAETYRTEKGKLDEYQYLQAPLGDTMPEKEFSINSFIFRVLDADAYDGFNYPKYFGMIATSDKNNSIAYLYFADVDLDYISTDTDRSTMSEFVKTYFQYHW